MLTQARRQKIGEISASVLCVLCGHEGEVGHELMKHGPWSFSLPAPENPSHQLHVKPNPDRLTARSRTNRRCYWSSGRTPQAKSAVWVRTLRPVYWSM